MESLASVIAAAAYTAAQTSTPEHPPQMTITFTPVLLRRVGRPSLPPDERIRRVKASKKAWQERNAEYVRIQIAEIQRRPESRARRAELDRMRWAAFKAARLASRNSREAQE